MRNWENEIARFVQKPDGSPLRVHVIRGLKPYALPPADIYLMHYLLLRGWKEALPEMALPTVIFDEIQELRHSGTEKYYAASLLAEAAQRVVGLSGHAHLQSGRGDLERCQHSGFSRAGGL